MAAPLEDELLHASGQQSGQSNADGSEARGGNQHQEPEEMNLAGFALQIMDAPAVGARQGSADALAALGLDRRLRLADGFIHQREASYRIRFWTEPLWGGTKRLYYSGILMEVIFVAVATLNAQQVSFALGRDRCV